MEPKEVRKVLRLEKRSQLMEQHTQGYLLLSEVARVLGVSVRQASRLKQRYLAEGKAGLADNRLGQGSEKRSIGSRRRDRIVRLKTGKYALFSVRHFWEQASAHDGVTASYATVLRVLQSAGVVEKSDRRGRYRRARKRQPARGMRMHLDSSMHAWLGTHQPSWDLTVAIDDADSRILHAHFAPQEGMDTSFRALKGVIRRYGCPVTLYTDRGAHFCTTTEAGKVDYDSHTQVQRALDTLGMEHLVAYTPQARGRSERAFKTLQDRLVSELALRHITDYDTANQYLQKRFIPDYNKRFTVKPESDAHCFFKPHPALNIDLVLSEHNERVVRQDFTIAYKKQAIQLPHRIVRPKHRVIVHRFADNALAISARGTAFVHLRPDGKLDNTVNFSHT